MNLSVSPSDLVLPCRDAAHYNVIETGKPLATAIICLDSKTESYKTSFISKLCSYRHLVTARGNVLVEEMFLNLRLFLLTL